MTKKQRREHKIGNQMRKSILLQKYYKADLKKLCWIPLGGVCQNGKHTFETGIPFYDNLPTLT